MRALQIEFPHTFIIILRNRDIRRHKTRNDNNLILEKST